MNNIALITGASSGIGMELARIHAARGGDLVLVARREKNLLDLKESLTRQFGIEAYVIVQDLAAPDAGNVLFEGLKKNDLRVEYLINNAGFGDSGLFHERPRKREMAMIGVNVGAMVELTRLVLPEMVERNRGRILNVASTVSFFPGPSQAVYHATKAFVLSFSEAIAAELSNTNVTVTALCPGATKTEFREAAGLDESSLFNLVAASAEFVAEYGYRAMLSGKRIAVPGLINKLAVGMSRFLPRRMATAMAGMARKHV